MGQYTSYWMYQRFEQRGSQDPIPVYPNTYSIDGDGTMPLVVRKDDDEQCGYIPPVEPIYRWTNIPITQDYICDDCSVAQYRWVNLDPSVDYYCEDTTKYYKQKKQVSYDNGVTWQDVTPPEYQRGGVAEEQSTDCGYVPPTPTGNKLTATYSDGKTLEVECNYGYSDVIDLASGETRPSGYEPSLMTNAVIGDCVNGTIGFRTFYNCASLTSVTIGNNVRVIGEEAFNGCGGLPNVTIPDSVDYIYDKAFEGCTSLTSVTLSNNLTIINGYTFQYCGSFTSVGPVGSGASVEIPNNITKIDRYVFDNCIGLTSVTIPDSVTEIGIGIFSDCSGLMSAIIGSGVTSISEYAFAGCSTLTSVTIPNSVTNIGNDAFRACTSLTSVGPVGSGASVEIPNSVTTIGSKTFIGCTGLTSATIPDSVTTIGAYVFSDCDSLTSLTIGNGVTEIVDYAFNYIASLKDVTIGSGVEYIGNRAFQYCTGLTSITCLATTPPTLRDYVFLETNKCPIYVPCESVSAYKAAPSWSDYGSRIQAMQPCSATYRWINLDPSVDYYCEGTTKYYKQKKQVSFDGGQTWEDVTPAEYQEGGVAETESRDCDKHFDIIENTFSSGCTQSLYSFSLSPVYCGGSENMKIKIKNLSRVVFEHVVCGTMGRGTYLSFYLDGALVYNRPCSSISRGQAGYVERYTLDNLPDDGEEHEIMITGNYAGSGRSNYFAVTYN